MEIKKALKEKKQKLAQEFEGNMKEAKFYMDGKNKLIEKVHIIDKKLVDLQNKGALIAAKTAAIDDMLKE